VYGDAWPSIRAALLSLPKYCALVNNYGMNCQDTHLELMSLGANNLLELASRTELRSSILHRRLEWRKSINQNVQNKPNIDLDELEGDENSASQQQRLPPLPANVGLQDFMPVKRVPTEREEMLDEEIEQSFFIPADPTCAIVPDTYLNLPSHLVVLACERGEVSLFPPPKMDATDILSNY